MEPKGEHKILDHFDHFSMPPPKKTVLIVGHTLIEYLCDGLTWGKSFANENVSLSEMNMGVFEEKTLGNI